ncbi:MAG TPA: SIMPL domain-containing protein [Pirellulales bacterium]|nr:SIMPL domain-containing protein [Pirellulales bacterium]
MKSNLRVLLAVLLLQGLCYLAKADDSGILVSATGESTIKPNRLEIEIKASASAELTGDAVVKYRDALRRAKEAFEKLKIEKLELEDRGMNVANSAAGNNNVNGFVPNGAAPTAKPEVNISKSLRLSVTGIDKLSEEDLVSLVAKLLDTAKDAGVSVGNDANNSLMMRINGMSTPVAMVTFVADDPSTARQAASEKAFTQAQQKAQKLAEMAGAQLGPVLSMEEGGASSGKQESLQERMIEMIYGGGNSNTAEDPRLTSSLLIDMPVRVNLRVRFELEPKANGAAK